MQPACVDTNNVGIRRKVVANKHFSHLLHHFSVIHYIGFDACFPDSVIGVVPNPKEADIGFVEYLLQSFKAHIQAMGQGAAQANINMGTFENQRFPFPPVAEQKQIVSTLDVLSKETQHLESIYRQKLTALEVLRKSLLHQAFTGQLRAAA